MSRADGHDLPPAADSLTALDERLEQALRASGIGVWEWDLSGGAVRVSDAVGPLFGLLPGEGPFTIRGFLRDHCHPGDRPLIDDALDLLLTQDAPADLRFRSVQADGSERLLGAHARLVRDDAGKPLRLVGVVHDAGDVGERRFRTLADSAPVLMWATGPDLACTFFNAAYLRFTGRGLADELGEGWREMVHPDDRELVRIADTRAEGGLGPFEARYRLRRHDGMYRWVQDSGVPVVGVDGRFEGLVGGIVDLHDLIEGEVLLDGIFAGAPVGIALFAPDLRYLRVNDSYAGITGVAAAEHIGHSIREIVPGVAAVASEMLGQVLRTGEAVHEAVITAPAGQDGSQRRLIASYIPLVIPGGEVAGLAALVRDDTERHSAQRRRSKLLERMTLLVDVSAVLDESLDAEGAVSELAKLLTEGFADSCEVLLGDARSPGGVRSSAVSVGGDGAASEPPGATHLVLMPIVARGRDLGALRLARGPQREAFSDDEASLVTEIGRRAGLALDNAQLVIEARAAERRTDESRLLLETLLERAPVGFAYLDRELRFVMVNRALAELTGLEPAAHIGRRVDELMPEMDPRVMNDLLEVLQTGRPLVDVEVIGATPGSPGRVRNFLASYYRVRIPGGGAMSLGVTFVEVTRRRIAEEELRAQRDLYETLLRAQSEAGEAFVLFSGNKVAFANEAAQELTGRTIGEMRAIESYLDLVPAERRDEVVKFAAGIIGGSDPRVSFETEVQRPDGAITAVEVAARALRGSRGVQLVVLGRDVSERKAAERERERLLAAERAARREIEVAHGRASFLSGISAVLERSRRIRDALREVAELAVRDVADVVAIDVLPRRGELLERVAAAAIDEATRREMRRTLGVSRGLDEDHATVIAVRERRARWARDADAERIERSIGFGDLDPRLTRVARIHSFGLVPLIARGSVVGVLSLGWHRGRAEPGGTERELIDDFAQRIALWIDNSQLYDERAQVASTLQTALLPPELPVVPGVEMAARYLPADEASEVGGDFYDVFRAGEMWVVVVGDVCGKGAEAAAATALARYTLRAAFAGGITRPADGFALLDATMLSEGHPERFLTAVLAVLRPARDGSVSVCLARGGHPAPIVLRAGGGRETADVDGRLIGVEIDGGWDERELVLHGGDAMLLYTDGVTESDRRRSLEADELAALLPADSDGMSSEQLADALVDVARERGGERLRDDVAALALVVPRGS